jgi:N-acetylneuraminic acid mutarotase
MAACAVGSDIYVFGGFSSDGLAHFSVFKFDTEANVWSTLAPMPLACSYHSAGVLGGLIYVVGAGDHSDEVLRFDPASGAWSTLAPTTGTKECGAPFVAGGCLYVAGGVSQPKRVERYDVASNTWTVAADMLAMRTFLFAVTIGSAGPVEELDLFDSLIAKACSGRP